jgi:microcystin-dependent protein
MSNYTKATNFTAKDGLPAGNSSKVVKGAELDTEFTAISAAISSKADTNSPTFTGTPLAPTAAGGTNNTQIATTAFVTTAVAASFPAGGIIMWSGSVASIPSGWALCNGSNGTPDLRNRFVVGAGSTYAVDATGGSADAIVVSHTHTATSSSSVTDPGHAHNVDGAYGGGGNPGGSLNVDNPSGKNRATTTATTGITVATSTTVASAGSSGTNANLPPYYALAYIIKL